MQVVVSDEKSVDIAFDDSEEEEVEEERGRIASSVARQPSGMRAGGSHRRGEGRTVPPGGSGEGGDMEDEGFCILDSPTSTIVVCLLFVCFAVCKKFPFRVRATTMQRCLPFCLHTIFILLHSLCRMHRGTDCCTVHVPLFQVFPPWNIHDECFNKHKTKTFY